MNVLLDDIMRDNNKKPATGKNTIRLVSVNDPMFDRLVMHGTPAQTRQYGSGHFIEEETAIKLQKYAEAKRITFVVNSALRTPGVLTGQGSSHFDGTSMDFETIIFDDEINGKVSGSIPKEVLSKATRKIEKESRRQLVAADIISSPEYGLYSGAEAYKTFQSNMVTLTDHRFGVSYDANIRETVHIGNLSGREYGNDQEALKELHHKQIKEASDLRSRGHNIKDVDVIEIELSDSGSPPSVKYLKNYQGDKAFKSFTTPHGPHRVLDKNQLNQITRGPATNSHASHMSDGKLRQSQIGLNQPRPEIPIDLSSASAGNTIEVNPQAMNALRNVTEADYGVTATLEKRYKNAVVNKSPHGQEKKHEGPPVAIKLVLDKLRSVNRTQHAVKAWDRLQAARLDYIDCFIAEQTQVISEERYNLSQSVSEEYKIFFSGKRPQVLTMSGHLFNTYNHQWLYDFEFFYENYLRGSKAVENCIRIFLTIADAVHEVILLKFAFNNDSNFDGVARYSMDYILLQTLHTGDYKDPISRSREQYNAKLLPIANTQTNYTPDMKEYINSYAETFPISEASAEASANRAISRDDVRDSDYARLMKQILAQAGVYKSMPESHLSRLINRDKSEAARPMVFSEDSNNSNNSSSNSSNYATPAIDTLGVINQNSQAYDDTNMLCAPVSLSPNRLLLPTSDTDIKVINQAELDKLGIDLKGLPESLAYTDYLEQQRRNALRDLNTNNNAAMNTANITASGGKKPGFTYNAIAASPVTRTYSLSSNADINTRNQELKAIRQVSNALKNTDAIGLRGLSELLELGDN